MTVGVLGLMGEGKTYSLVQMMLDKMELGEPVASNIELNERGVDMYFGGWQDWRKLYRHLEIGKVVLDEKTGQESMHPDDDPWHWPEGDSRSTSNGARVSIVIDESGEFLDPDNPGGKGRIRRILGRMRHSDKFG